MSKQQSPHPERAAYSSGPTHPTNRSAFQPPNGGTPIQEVNNMSDAPPLHRFPAGPTPLANTSPQQYHPPLHDSQYPASPLNGNQFLHSPPIPPRKPAHNKWWVLGISGLLSAGIVITTIVIDDKPTPTSISQPATEEVSVTSARPVEVDDASTREDRKDSPAPQDPVSAAATTPVAANEKKSVEPGTSDGIPAEHVAALNKAENYLDFATFSQAGLFNQLTSEYGEGFPPDAAQYAIDNIDVDWNEQALRSAENYLDFSSFSKAGLYDQLVSEYGEGFMADQAQYAVDNVQVDWNEEALESALGYRDLMNMSDASIYDQLVSQYGEGFTAEQAQYAIDNLP